MQVKVYMASGWFTERTETLLTSLENTLREIPNVSPYFPRHDGIKLSANAFHDHKLREKVFLDNVSHIDEADFILANLDCYDEVLDTGTIWEVGRASAKHIPILAFDMTGTLKDRLPGLYNGFFKVFSELEEVREFFNSYRKPVGISDTSKVLFIGPESTEEQKSNTLAVASMIAEIYNDKFRWVDKLSHDGIATLIDEIFSNVEVLVAVIDDRDPVVSWMIGQAYTRGIPVISYTNYDYGVNIMLACSLVAHVKGIDNLKNLLHRISREGLSSLEKFDSSSLKAY